MIQKAEQARNEAASEHAEQFAMDYWAAGEKAWQEASAKLDAQSNSEAYTLLLKAKTSFDKAHSQAKSKREVAIKEITDQQGTATLRLKKDLVDNPAVKQLSASRRKLFDEKVKEIEDTIAKVGALLQNGQYTDSRLLVQKTQREIWEVQQEYLKK